MFQRIVVPLDGSERAEQALPLAARLARASEGALLLVRGVPPYSDAVWYGEGSAAFMPEITNENLEEGKRYVKAVATSPGLAGIDVETEVTTGQPAEVILSTAKAKHVDLIVMCSHGYTGIQRWMLGSVAQKVARHSAIPVLILCEGTALPAEFLAKEGRSLRIMVTLDGSALSETALEPAAYLSTALSAPEPGVLHLVRILRIPTAFEYGQSDSIARARTEGTAEAMAYLSILEDRLHEGELARLNLKVTSSVDCDLDVAQRLITLAESNVIEDGVIGHDMIALATHGRSGVARWVMGSVAERVLGTTSLPLLIVRPEKEQFMAQADSAAQEATREDAADIYPWGALL